MNTTPRFSFAKAALLAASLSTLTLLSACGGGSADAGTPVVPQPAPVEITVTHKVRITTNKGIVELGLDNTHAPITTTNFLKYANAGFYNGLLFHRVIKDFMIQGGGFSRTGTTMAEKAPLFPAIKLESQTGLRNARGTIGMARLPAPDSATAQFYINVKDNTFLNYGDPNATDRNGYAVFGKVLVGMDIVDQISVVSTTAGDVPVTDVTIIKIEELK